MYYRSKNRQPDLSNFVIDIPEMFYQTTGDDIL